MLHHANVDRLWAYWQALRPESTTFDYEYRGLPRFSSPGGSIISVNSPLQPFLQTDGTWHTSKSVDSIRTFGYTYEGLDYWKKSTDEMKRDTAQIINKLYGPNSQPWHHDNGNKKPSSTSSAVPSAATKTPSSTSKVAPSIGKAPSSATKTSSAVIESASPINETPSSVNTTSPVSNQPVPSVDQDTVRFFANVSIDVTHLPFRPCSIDVYVGGRQAGSMVIMKQPAEGILYDGFPLDHAIRASGLDRGISVDEILARAEASLKVVISKVCSQSIKLYNVHN